ncbi:MAG: helix-turn-helix transcriptional regulator [Parabacteroides sp.]|nr:helix-turn-helix transcriptional regulator [Parabacteroides sp.]
MKERILKVMETEGYSQAQFAAEIGIQRAAMSHIISGRNNPSLDVLLKILRRFPSVSTDWLLFGNGPMTKSAQPAEPAENTTVPTDSNVAFADSIASSLVHQEKERVVTVEKPAKTISKIMVFYTDNTFDTYTLEKK